MDKAYDLAMDFLRPQWDAMPITEDDYLGDNDLIHCVKCDTRKQTYIEINGERLKVKVLCQCQEAELDKEEAEYKARRKAERLSSWQSGEENKAWNDSHFDEDDHRDCGASNKTRAYAKNFDEMFQNNTGLMLYGGLGSGKTYLAACIANDLMDSQYRVLMTNVSNLISSMNADYGEAKDWWLNRIAKADLLILDDFGTERTTEYSLEQTYEIINTRYKAKRPLVITTNLSVNDIQAEKSQGIKRIYDRIIEITLPVLVKGDSRRIDIAKNNRQAMMDILEGKA